MRVAGGAEAASPGIPVVNATPTEAQAVRDAIAGLTYQLPRNAVTFAVAWPVPPSLSVALSATA